MCVELYRRSIELEGNINYTFSFSLVLKLLLIKKRLQLSPIPVDYQCPQHSITLTQIWLCARRRIGVESNLGRLEMKDQRLEWNPLDFNTSVGGSLSEIGYRKW